ncbi:unnamed protein product [Withania somnifera]
MESSRKRRTGFMKGKLMKSLYRGRAAVKPTTSTTNYSSDDSPPQTIYHLHLHHHQPKEKIVPYNPNSITIVNQEYKAAPPLKPKVSYYIPPQSIGVGTKESVDIKAANYISCVRERFRSNE